MTISESTQSDCHEKFAADLFHSPSLLNLCIIHPLSIHGYPVGEELIDHVLPYCTPPR